MQKTMLLLILLLLAASCSFDTGGLSGNNNINNTNNTSSNNAVCGDNVVARAEQCDGVDLGGAKCTNIGFNGGQLLCNADCTFDTSMCLMWENCTDGIDNNDDGKIDCDDPQCATGPACADDYYSTQFDSSGEYIHFPTFVNILETPPYSFAISFWIKPWGPPSNYATPVSATDGSTWDQGLGFYIVGNKVVFWVNHYANYAVTSTTELQPGQWYHIVGSINGALPSGNQVLFINGRSEASRDMTENLVIPPVPFEVGAVNSGEYGFVGCIDEVAVWDVALGGLSVQSLYNNGAPFDLREPLGDYDEVQGLRAFWKMGDGDTLPYFDSLVGQKRGEMFNYEGDEIVTDVPGN